MKGNRPINDLRVFEEQNENQHHNQNANNNENEMYGKDNLSKFFNKFKNNNEPIEPLLNEIKQFTKDTEQFDDMTLLYLKIRND